jgi:tetratricopeptide (TPR) repeat protein
MSSAFTALLFLLVQQARPEALCDALKSTAIAEEARREASNRQFEIAARKFQEAIDSCPHDSGLLVEQANALLMAQRFAEARAAATNVLEVDEANASALKIKANAEYFLGDFDRAENTFIRLLDRHPRDEDGAYMLGRMYYQEGRVDQAMGQFQRVLKLNPRSYKAWDNLGLCWQANGNDDKAIAHFLQAIKLVETDHPDYDWAYANLAELLLKKGDAERAFGAASKAASRNPRSARNFYLGAKALDKLGKTELCLNWLQRAAALDPNYAEPEYLLSRVYHRLGQRDKADEAQKRFLELKAKEPAKRR